MSQQHFSTTIWGRICISTRLNHLFLIGIFHPSKLTLINFTYRLLVNRQNLSVFISNINVYEKEKDAYKKKDAHRNVHPNVGLEAMRGGDPPRGRWSWDLLRWPNLLRRYITALRYVDTPREIVLATRAARCPTCFF